MGWWRPYTQSFLENGPFVVELPCGDRYGLHFFSRFKDFLKVIAVPSFHGFFVNLEEIKADGVHWRVVVSKAE
jgi:hypothetical protein